MAGNMSGYHFNSSGYHNNQITLNDLNISSSDPCSLSVSSNSIPLNIDSVQFTPERRPSSLTPCVSLVDVPSNIVHSQRSTKKSINRQNIPRLARQHTVPVSINQNNNMESFSHFQTNANHFCIDYQNFVFPSTVEEALANLNLLHYQKCFFDQEIDMGVFLSLNEDDLREIGVDRLGGRRRILACINTLRSWKISNLSNSNFNKTAHLDNARIFSSFDQSNSLTRQAMEDILTNSDRLLECHKHLSREIVSNLAWAGLSMRGDIQNWLHKIEDNAQNIREAILTLKLNILS